MDEKDMNPTEEQENICEKGGGQEAPEADPAPAEDTPDSVEAEEPGEETSGSGEETADTDEKTNEDTDADENEEALSPAEKEKVHRSVSRTVLCNVYDWLEIFAFSIAAVIVIFTFIIRLAIVDGGSMNDTLQNGETLVVSRLSAPRQGDIIVFQSDYKSWGEPLVKRVIAVGGQTVDIDFENWEVTVDGKKLDETYVKYIMGRAMLEPPDGQTYPLEVPEGMLFVMGDNRNDSLDSRSLRIGLVSRELVLGRVILRLFPFDRFGTIK